MTEPHDIDLVKIAPVAKQLNPIALGGFVFGADPWKEQKSGLFGMLEIALKKGMNHFDTAAGYGSGQSEKLIGQFLLLLQEDILFP